GSRPGAGVDAGGSFAADQARRHPRAVSLARLRQLLPAAGGIRLLAQPRREGPGRGAGGVGEVAEGVGVRGGVQYSECGMRNAECGMVGVQALACKAVRSNIAANYES